MLASATTLPIVFLSRIIDGVTAGNLTLAQAYISDVTPPENRAKSFGIIGIAFGLGFLVGPALSGFLSQYGYQYPIYAAAGLSAVSIMATTFILPRKPPVIPGVTPISPEGTTGRMPLVQWGRYVEYFRRPELWPLLVKFFSYVFSFSIFVGGFALFAERRYMWNGHPFGPKEVGYVFAFSGLIGGTLQGGALGMMVRRFGERPLMRAGLIACSIGYLFLAYAYTIPVLLISASISAFGGIVRPIVTSLITQVTGRREQGTVLGLTQSLTSVAQITGPLLAGVLIQHRLLATWGVVAAAVAFAGWIVPTPLAPPVEIVNRHNPFVIFWAFSRNRGPFEILRRNLRNNPAFFTACPAFSAEPGICWGSNSR